MGPAKASFKPSVKASIAPRALALVLPMAPAPADPLPTFSEESADVSMKEAEEEELCQAFSDALLMVQDVDEEDGDLPQLCSEYVKDIYSYLHVLEVIHPSSNALFSHPARLSVTSVCLHRWSRLYDPTTCSIMRSLSACGLSWWTGWSRCTPGSSCCRRLCTSQLPSWIDSSR